MRGPSKAQPADETVWLRSTALGETRPFEPTHAAALLALQRSQGHDDWQPTEAPAQALPEKASKDAPAPADDSATRRRTPATRKPR